MAIHNKGTGELYRICTLTWKAVNVLTVCGCII
jgi:hypothetical protein